jgi:trk system potassium uptake protein TrkH
LAIMGGGVATTAGGIKLLRVYVLYKHGMRELEKLRYPSSVGGSGKKIRAMRKDGAYIAWVTLMLFVLSIGIVMLTLSATGISFEDSLALAIAGLSTTGPLLAISSDTGLSYSEISDASKVVLCVAMILGRLEALAVIALMNASLWQK